MDRTTLVALKCSIGKWRKIVDLKGADLGSKNCALCRKFAYYEDCIGCPVREKSGTGHCYETPYEAWSNHLSVHRQGRTVRCKTCSLLAQEEWEFLKSLLPRGVKRD